MGKFNMVDYTEVFNPSYDPKVKRAAMKIEPRLVGNVQCLWPFSGSQRVRSLVQFS